MLTWLKIHNYALIRELDIPMNEGFSIITGETGAGKSILLGALSLILGQRAETSVLKDKAKKCFVEGVFDVSAYGFKELFEGHELDYEPEAILRREINPSGKSRAFINDTPVNLKTMREIGLRLVDIHSQHQNLELSEQNFQLKVLDTCADNSNLLQKYQGVYREYRNLLHALKEIEEQAAREKSDIDYYQFQFEQLDAAKLVEGEQDEMEREQELLSHTEEIKSNLTELSEILNAEDGSVIGRVRDGMNRVGRLTDFLEEAPSLHQRLESVYLELRDIADESEMIAERVEYDPERVTFLNERLDLIYTLQQKHQVSTVKELIELRDSYAEKISVVDSYDSDIEELKKDIQIKEAEILQIAEELSVRRKGTAPEIENRVIDILHQLGMLNARFRVDTVSNGHPGPMGIDTVNFLFSGNKNAEFNEISKVASGGEMSRLMLALKSLLSRSKALPTIIFDEIDAGISGEVAGKMGGILREMSSGMQVINITHLPQVAARGDHHYWVYKEDTETETITRLKLLTKEERIEELAKMLSGENITPAALQNAQELLR